MNTAILRPRFSAQYYKFSWIFRAEVGLSYLCLHPFYFNTSESLMAFRMTMAISIHMVLSCVSLRCAVMTPDESFLRDKWHKQSQRQSSDQWEPSCLLQKAFLYLFCLFKNCKALRFFSYFLSSHLPLCTSVFRSLFLRVSITTGNVNH